MVTCAVPGCDSSKKENSENYTFHKFPLNVDVRQKWLKMVNRTDWTPKKYSSICSKHFEPVCFSRRGVQRVKLRFGSIPTLFMPIVLKQKRKMSSYIYKDISPVPISCTQNVSDLDNSPRNNMSRTVDVLRRRLDIKEKKLKNLRAQKKRACEKVVKLSQMIKKLENNSSFQNDVTVVMESHSNDLL